MKKNAVLLQFSIVLITLTASFCKAAHFEYYAGGFTAASYNYCEDYYYYSGPYSDSNSHAADLNLEDYSMAMNANTSTTNSVVVLADSEILYLRMLSTAGASSMDADAQGNCNGSIATRTPQTLGVFYKIMPDTGEANGKNMLLYVTGTSSIDPTGLILGTVQGTIKGVGTMNHLAITRNQLPPVASAPNADKEIWSTPETVQNNYYYWTTEDIYKHNVKIGDVIGLFMSCGTSNSVSGEEMGTVISNVTATLSLKPLVQGDLDEDGDVDLSDFSKMAANWLSGT